MSLHKSTAGENYGRGRPQGYGTRQIDVALTNSYTASSAQSYTSTAAQDIMDRRKSRGATRPSGLPRSASSSSSQARLSHIASTRPAPAFAGKSPPLQAMSLPYLDTARQDRRTITETQQTLSPIDTDDDTVLGVVMPIGSTSPPSTLPPRLIPELQALAAGGRRPSYGPSSAQSFMSSPSTQFTASSSPWSASTAATTPVSWSSASPNITQSSVTSSKRSHTVPVPPNPRTRIPKLPILPESHRSVAPNKINVSDSDGLKSSSEKTKTPTNLPDRTTSLQSNRSRSNSTTTQRSHKNAVSGALLPSSPVPPVISTVPILPSERGPGFEAKKQAVGGNKGHSRLQQALKKAENVDVAHDATSGLSSSQNEIHSPRPRQLLEPLPVVQTTHRRLPSLSRRHQRTPSSSEPESEKSSARSRLAKFSRMALFGRSKTASESDPKPNKLQSRKGPAAGTGHEGYGKFGRKTKKPSVGSSIAATDSDLSLTSSKSQSSGRRPHRVSTSSQEQSDLDDFAAAHMKPIPILGGSQRGRSNPFPPVFQQDQRSDMSVNTISTTDSYPAYPAIASHRRERFPPQHSFEESRPSIASTASQPFNIENESFQFPLPGTSGDDQHRVHRSNMKTTDIPKQSNEMFRVDTNMLVRRSKSKKSKWNIFRRKNSVSEALHPSASSTIQPRVSVDVVHAQTTRAVPFYAMPGSETDFHDHSNICQLLREAAESPEKQSLYERDEKELVHIGFSDHEVENTPYNFRESILLPTAPLRQQARHKSSDLATPQTSGEIITTVMSEKDAMFPKQPRLAQVGRIPPVISTKNQPETVTLAFSHDHNMTANRLRRQASREHLPKLQTDDLCTMDRNQAYVPPVQKPVWQQEMSQRAERDGEFLKYADTRNSDFTSSSDSTGLVSLAGPPALQQPFFISHQPHHAPEEEVWNEYDDYLDDIMSPSSSITSPQKKTKTRTVLPRKSKQQLAQLPKDSGIGLAIMPSLEALPFDQRYLAPPPLLLSSASSFSDLDHGSSDDVRLRRSKIAAALHASYAPSSPFSMRDFIDEYYERGSGKYSERLSSSSAQVTTPRIIAAPAQRDRSNHRQYDNAVQLEQVERDRNPTKHSDQLYTSMVVARWLSFGRVLFSPAHQEIESSSEKHVLVIDGLGSEDWSMYCAVTYQNSKTLVHQLKERGQDKSRSKATSTVGSAPSNFRSLELASFNERFPFPSEFFCAIVVRFPPAMPDSKLKNIVAECRRTLAPEGYLELMLLDLDIVNMGAQTRRAIKDLKIKLTTADRSISLKPLIDNVQTVLGSNGFSNLNRCVVGVPVVGKPINSMDSSSDSRSSTESRDLSQSTRPKNPYGVMSDQANFSLNDLVADHSENADAKIGKMVSRTARSWWQHCFEAGFVAEGGKSKSVFANKEVLSECKNRASSFKLLIAYTQKSSAGQQKRRTMSEPSVSTMATLGSPELQSQRMR